MGRAMTSSGFRRRSANDPNACANENVGAPTFMMARQVQVEGGLEQGRGALAAAIASSQTVITPRPCD
jgi:hypothetical protein